MENTNLKQRVRQLTENNRLLDQKLQAARSNNRFLDKRLADIEAELVDNQMPRPVAPVLRDVRSSSHRCIGRGPRDVAGEVRGTQPDRPQSAQVCGRVMHELDVKVVDMLQDCEQCEGKSWPGGAPRIHRGGLSSGHEASGQE
ncbi:hypothetical protein ACQEVC_24065 [Plantactinospora sp. CA-294935]|uniref:hypothetical protein n=1 Tax=Plantactinospora sp. CA-294935 TaxID=3240012 RepID=UPI003D93AA7C